MFTRIILFGLYLIISPSSYGWGFHAHRLINRMAVFCLPQEMLPLYKAEIDYLEMHAVDPDKRRYAVAEEAARHFIDLEFYCRDSKECTLPQKRQDAVALFSEDSLQANGEVPWHILRMMFRLEKAFTERNRSAILKLSADLGHYIGDAHVPLHTTDNHNGQKTGQTGIHGFWEGRIPELCSKEYSYWAGKAEYLSHPEEAIWEAVWESHRALDTVFSAERESMISLAEDERYGYESRGSSTQLVRSEKWARLYAEKMQGMVERRMIQAIQLTAAIWFTCWVNAGKPDLRFEKKLPDPVQIQEEEELEKKFQTANSPLGKSHCD